MTKKEKGKTKEMSEGKTIALAVIVFTIGLITIGYLLQFVINYFFPNLF